MLRVAVIGYGYWGPNLVRNFVAGPRTSVVAIVDHNPAHRELARSAHPQIRVVEELSQVLDSPELDAIAMATPLATRFELARSALLAGKHVLVEKPLAASIEQAEALVQLAAAQRRVLMVDHTLVYTGAARKIRELIAAGELGRVHYIDAVRINLGRVRPDLSVIWDLAPHDLTVMDFVLDARPRWISAIGASHRGRQEDHAYVTVGYDGDLLGHIHVNWVAPVKTRRTLIAGSKQMLVWDDTASIDPLEVYENGDVCSPRVDAREALSVMTQTFAAACLDGAPSPSDASVGLRIVRMLAAAQQSLERQGARITL